MVENSIRKVKAIPGLGRAPGGLAPAPDATSHLPRMGWLKPPGIL
jgi:hypothetical protein